MTRVPLWNRRREVVAYALVDCVDAEVVLALRWHLDGKGYPARFHQRLHEFVTERMGIAGAEHDTDHVNGNKLDNRRANLRSVSRVGNTRKVGNRLSRLNTSGVRGVWWSEERQRWCVQGTLDGKKYHLGRFRTLDEAKTVREEWETEHWTLPLDVTGATLEP